MAKVIEFYIPENLRKQSGKWMPLEQRGKIIPFLSDRKRSQHEMKAAQPHAPADPLVPNAVWERQGTQEFEHNFL